MRPFTNGRDSVSPSGNTGDGRECAQEISFDVRGTLTPSYVPRAESVCWGQFGPASHADDQSYGSVVSKKRGWIN
jgi:hypothetical protein